MLQASWSFWSARAARGCLVGESLTKFSKMFHVEHFFGTVQSLFAEMLRSDFANVTAFCLGISNYVFMRFPEQEDPKCRYFGTSGLWPVAFSTPAISTQLSAEREPTQRG